MISSLFISSGSCSELVALNDLVTSVWRSHLTLSFLEGCSVQQEQQTCTAHSPLVIPTSMRPRLIPFAVLLAIRNSHEYEKANVLALLDCWTSFRPIVHPNGCILLRHLLQPSCQCQELACDKDCPLISPLAFLPPESASFLFKPPSTGTPDFVMFLMSTSPLILSDKNGCCGWV